MYETEPQAVRNLQRYLRQLLLEEDVTPLPPPEDGVWDNPTRQALTDFQASVGLPPTGEADPETWTRLYFAYQASLRRTAPAARLPIFPETPPGAVIGRGEKSFAVRTVQHLLLELEVVYGGEVPKQNGVYEETTEAAVRRFQEQNGLPATGRTDRMTWNALVAQFDALRHADDF